MSSDQIVPVRHATRAKGHKAWRIALTSAAAVATFGLVMSATVVMRFEQSVDTISEEQLEGLLGPDRPASLSNPTDPSAGSPINILLLGTDVRTGENATIGGDEAGARADTTLLLHVSADRTRVEVVSFPRDVMLDLAACQRSDGSTQRAYFGMFNEPFANGYKNTESYSDGAACTIATVEANTDILIDHFAVIDFYGFQRMVDAIGGVPMCIPEEYADPYSGTYLEPGPQTLSGGQAVAYVRMRKGINTSGSDLDRIDRQQQFLKNLASTVISADMLYRPQDVTEFVLAVADSLTMNENFSDVAYLTGLAFSLRNLDPSTGIIMATAPVEAYPENPNHVQFSRKADALWAAIASDQPIAALLDQQSASPANDPAVTASPQPAVTSSATAGTPSDTPSQEPAVDPDSAEGILAACQAG